MTDRFIGSVVAGARVGGGFVAGNWAGRWLNQTQMAQQSPQAAQWLVPVAMVFAAGWVRRARFRGAGGVARGMAASAVGAAAMATPAGQWLQGLDGFGY